MHSVESLQYVLTQLADLTGDEKSTVLLVKAAQGLVLQIHVHEYISCTWPVHVYMFSMVNETTKLIHLKFTVSLMFTGTNSIVHY